MCTTVQKYLLLIVLFGLCSSAQANSRENPTNSFTCDNNKTIPRMHMCDNFNDCLDNSDEKASICLLEPRDINSFFYCSNGARIDPIFVCDGFHHCSDSFDELYYFCKYYKADYATKKEMTEKLNGIYGDFQCSSGECIRDFQRCDGKMDCPEGWDETPEICLRDSCQSTMFTCGYGACIELNGKCNGVEDCADASDEILNETNCSRTERIPSPIMNNIKIPQYLDYCPVPPLHKLMIVDRSKYLKEAIVYQYNITYVSMNPLIQFECIEGYETLKDNLSIKRFLCSKQNKWNEEPPKCHRKCPKIIHDESVTISCMFYDKIGVSCEKTLNGTIAKVACAEKYRRTTNIETNLICQDNGKWSGNANLTNYCEQICGQPEQPPNDDETHSNNTSSGIRTYQVPWHVALYNTENEERKSEVCSGSILNANWVLTAAHCILTPYNESFPNEMYVVIANKQYADYSMDNRELYSQTQPRNIYNIIIHENYKMNHDFDIALMKVDRPFIFNSRVSAICVPTENITKEPKRNNFAYLGVYGSGAFKQYRNISLLYGTVDTNDKNIRVTFYIDNVEAVDYAKEGDSGGVVYVNINGTNYIRGIVSTGTGSQSKNVTLSNMYNSTLLDWVRNKVINVCK